MEVRNVQSPSFGMLRAKAAIPALRNSSTCSSKVIASLEEARKLLADTVFYHLEVGSDLGCRIVGSMRAYFGAKSFPNASYGTASNVVMVKNADGRDKYNISRQNRVIDKDFYTDMYKKEYKEFEAYDEHNAEEYWYPVIGIPGFDTVNDIKTLSGLTLQLDKAAINYYKEIDAKKAAEAKQYQADVDAFESNLVE